MNRKYNLKLDLQFRCNNSIMKFNQFDNNTSDFFIRITNSGNLVDIEKAIVVLAVIKPSGKVSSQFIEVKNGLVYVDLKPNMRDEIGTYTAKAMLILEDERVVTDVISYKVEEDKIFSLLNDSVETSEEFTLLTDMLSRLSNIEISEDQRVINEAERILSEENRKIEEVKRVEAELIRQHEEADRAKYDSTRESNENIRKQNESIRLTNETNRIDEEAKRVEEETKRVEAEQLRNANYNFMTEDEERRRLEANAHKEAEILRVQAETNRVNEEAKRRTTEQARVSAENTRVNSENIRKANEEERKSNETQRVEAETQRQNRYNSLISDAEANVNDFGNYTNTAKVKEEERKSNELDRKSQEDRRVSNEVERISNENTRKANEVAREKNETSRQYVFENKVNEVDKKIIEINTTKDNFVSSVNTKVDTKISEIDNVKDNFVSSINTKVDTKISEIEVAKSDMTNTVSNKINEVETRFNALTSSQQQDAEVIDARDGETSLKARLDRDIEKAKQVYVNVEGSHISTDSSSGYLKDVEILGNTVQDASNLADIRSVGDKIEGQELYEIPVLSCGKNLFDDKDMLVNKSIDDNGNEINANNTNTSRYIKIKSNTNYATSTIVWGRLSFYDENKKFLFNSKGSEANNIYVNSQSAKYVRISFDTSSTNIQLEEGTVATPYEPYVEDKLTILSPTQLEKVGDVRDRIIEKDGVWGVEKNVKTVYTKEFANVSIYEDKGDTYLWKISVDTKNTNVMSNFAPTGKLSTETTQTQVIIYDHTTKRELRLAFKKSDFPNFSDVSNVQEYLRDNDKYIKIVQDTQFIPLPHSQQVKLRTFANKTNISFLTEIEGTIKAQIPKSLGATVNTHTEQIGNLNKELDRVKKLEESTVSTVTTESDFTTVEATSNGYFEDVKLEGKTLVNLSIPKDINIESQLNKKIITNLYDFNKEYTLIFNSDKEDSNVFIQERNGELWVRNVKVGVVQGLNVIKFTSSPSGVDGIRLGVNGLTSYPININNIILLEGDHTQNPPSYFEGLKSVGQSATTSEDRVDEIVVSSVKGDGNLFDVDKIVSNYTEYFKCNDYIKYSNGAQDTYLKQDFEPNTQYSFTIKASSNASTNIDFTCRYTDGTYSLFTIYNRTANSIYTKTFISDANKTIEYFGSSYTDGSIITVYLDGTCINKGITPKPYVPYQSDKKRLLYYNTETQTWEKPILRQWDSIEKHTNGKYYYHVRSIEEDYVEGDESVSNYITDMTTTVKPLSQEKVYECTNIDLITYNGETNFIVESGAITPKTTLKVHNNISNVVSLLQKKVSLLESNVTSYMITQNRLMLASRYNADNVTFKVDYPSMMSEREVEIDYDLFKLIQDNIIVGPENYDVDKMLEIMDLYAMIGFITWEMWDYLYEVIDSQINPVIGDLEGAPEI